MKDQEVKRCPNQFNLYRQLEIVDCTGKDHPNPPSGVMGSLTGLTTYFHVISIIRPLG